MVNLRQKKYVIGAKHKETGELFCVTAGGTVSKTQALVWCGNKEGPNKPVYVWDFSDSTARYRAKRYIRDAVNHPDRKKYSSEYNYFLINANKLMSPVVIGKDEIKKGLCYAPEVVRIYITK